MIELFGSSDDRAEYWKGQTEAAMRFYFWTLVALVLGVIVNGFVHDSIMDRLESCQSALRTAQ